MEYIFNKLSEIKGVTIPKTQIGEETMTKLCQSAEKLFNELGYYETSVANICKHADTAVGTFYIYFKDKPAIYNFLIKNYYIVIKKLLREATKNCSCRKEIEFEGLKAFVRFGLQNPQCYKIIWGSIYINPQIFSEYYTNFAKSYIRTLERDSEQLKIPDSSTAAYMLMGIANFICLKVILSENEPTEKRIDEITRWVIDMLSNGIFKS